MVERFSSATMTAAATVPESLSWREERQGIIFRHKGRSGKCLEVILFEEGTLTDLTRNKGRSGDCFEVIVLEAAMLRGSSPGERERSFRGH